QLGVETLHTWLGWNESDMLTWTFDLTMPPPVPYTKIANEAGMLLSSQDITGAGRERDALARWSGVRQYVHALYSERAVQAEVTAFSRYNDNTYDRDIRLNVFDAGGVRLFYDLRLPWWERFGFSEQEITQYDEE